MRKWTLEERQRQSAMIKNWSPWKSSTGPVTEGGKAVAKMNAKKHGLRSEEIRTLRKIMREQQAMLSDLTGGT